MSDASYQTGLSDHRIDVSADIIVEGVRYGSIEIGLSTQRVEAEIAQALQLNLIVAALGVSLVAVFGYGLGSILTRQLRSLSLGATAIADGNLSHQIEVQGRDELADTARCFNHMATTLATDRDTLLTQQNELLAKKARVEAIVACMSDIVARAEVTAVPDTERLDEIGEMARATVVFQQAMRRVEEARIEQQRLIMAFDQVAEQVAIFDMDGKILFLNTSFRAANQDVLSNLNEDFSYEMFLRKGVEMGVYPDAIQDAEAWISKRLCSKQGERAPEETRRHPDRILLSLQTQVPGIGVVVSASDITELRQSQAQLVQSSKMATLGEMATGIAHELNQPLGVIRMAAANSVKRIEKGRGDLDYLTEKLKRIGDQTARAAQIIDHMRIFGRKPDGQKHPIDLRDSLEDVCQLFRPQMRNLNIQLSLNVPEEAGFATGEKVLFEQMLLNLLSNSRDAIEAADIPEGHVSIHAEFDTAEGHVIWLQDNGGGIPEEILNRVFEPFFTTKPPGKGTGLGLSIGFGTIKDMSGSISAKNNEIGACFKITLPPSEAVLAEAV
ncbi:MAG: HAMP domain-containing protein [Rhodobacteraceae bacterium]|nr:HAMP domain-containing protein [Paracoccaceae bacterium]